MKEKIDYIKKLFKAKKSESAILRYNTVIFEPEYKQLYTDLERGIHSPIKPKSKKDLYVSIFKQEFLKYIKGLNKVLDVGCGVGWPTFLLSPYVKRMIGIDLSEEMIKIAKVANERKFKMKNVDFRIANVESLPFSDAVFDAVIMDDSLALVSNKDKAINEIYRVLKPGGKVICKELMWPVFVKNNISYYTGGGHFLRHKDDYFLIYPLAEINPPKEVEFYLKIAKGSTLYNKLVKLNEMEISKIRTKDIKGIKSQIEKSFYFEVAQFTPESFRKTFEKRFRRVKIKGFSGDVVSFIWDKEIFSPLMTHKDMLAEMTVRISEYFDFNKFENCLIIAEKI